MATVVAASVRATAMVIATMAMMIASVASMVAGMIPAAVAWREVVVVGLVCMIEAFTAA